MNTEETVSPVAETQNQATEIAEVTPEVAAPEQVEAPKEEAVSPKDETTKSIERMQRRIDKRTADVYRERAAKEQLAQRVAQLEAQSGQEVPRETSNDPMVIAREIARVEKFTERANSIYNEGVKAHTDYSESLKSLAAEVGNFVEPNGAPSRFMEAVLEVSDHPTELLYHLGKNPDIAEELADLSPYKLAKRLDRIERELTDKSKPKPSSAPIPITPPKGTGPVVKDPSRMTDKEFAAWRRAEIEARR